MPAKDPIRPTDDEARALARGLIDDARFGALGVIDPDSGAPMVTRIAVACDAEGGPVTLISDIAQHAQALAANPACSLLVGEPGDKGNPLVHPRLTLQCRAEPQDKATPDYAALRALYLQQQPKAKLYIDFGDFRLVRLAVQGALLNGGFGQAFRLTPDDLARR
jgi:putative heme iron utilization protein